MESSCDVVRHIVRLEVGLMRHLRSQETFLMLLRYVCFSVLCLAVAEDVRTAAAAAAPSSLLVDDVRQVAVDVPSAGAARRSLVRKAAAEDGDVAPRRHDGVGHAEAAGHGLLEQDSGSGSYAALPTTLTGWSTHPETWTVLGCYPRLPSDDVAPGQVGGVRDTYCKEFNVTANSLLCRSGLPFYRLVANEMSPGVCKSYCLGKGLDIAGLVANKECRCGASGRVTSLWGGRAPLPHLRFQPESMKLSDSSDQCQIIAFKYVGELYDGGVPPKMLTQTALDLAYIQRVGCPTNDCSEGNA
eukprot:TRINITY_DN28693_c0_g2_i4.p2 TRINITY_DN28693_c0_g2~~TRINITY_DN28693_c0_g2_i4.p2  ORF type:complete len:300 (-),score=43.74 TRINITY_DN28693_c0_g2_i4:40-939(-)